MSATSPNYKNKLSALHTLSVSNVGIRNKHAERKLSCLLVNPDVVAKALIKKTSFNKKFSYNIWSGPMDNKLIKYLRKNQYDYIVVDRWISEQAVTQFLDLVRFHEVNNGRIINIASFYEKVSYCSPTIHMNSYAENNPDDLIVRPSSSLIFTKRAIDIGISIFALPFAIPIVILAAFITKLTSKGPVFFKQERIGLNGKVFTLFKIRTMFYNPIGVSKPTVKDDKRITKAGLILRKTKIDELPQFLNVLKGDMSLIGPRPERIDIVDRFNHENNFYQYRHLVKPGITGWAQVNYPTATPEENLEKLEYDLYYINNISPALEIKIILKTIGVITTMESL